ncbi:DnaJ domain-containing protein [Desulfosarcina sp. OttesenSCG-928-A07]|nr:DnaJ domain-containing protein [Desulfosarcina sp. OttesenSCG-928-G17]MDL2329806.1 DnaJ domain-containing protein [Desulfosarcina sp. OttesenSCG-928-A07]
MSELNYYQILNVECNADAQKIKTAYRELAFQYHPDRNEGDPASADKMKSINEAYAVLSDPDKRREYDLLRQRFGDGAQSRFRSAYTEQEIFRGSDVHQIFEEVARSFGLRGLDGLFGDFTGQKVDININGLTGKGFIYKGEFGPGLFGQKGKSPMAKTVSPRMAKFMGSLFEKATGISLPREGEDIHDTLHLTKELAASGGEIAYSHPKRSTTLMITISPGTKDGQRIRLTGMGEEGKQGAKAGDLYLKLKVKKPFLEKARDVIVAAVKRY